MKTTIQLSDNAKKLYSLLVQTGGAHEEHLIDMMFSKPIYVAGEQNSEYWQYDANIYGNERTMTFNGITTTYTKNVDVDFAKQVSMAYQELKKAGMAYERNNGYNCYTFFPKK